MATSIVLFLSLLCSLVVLLGYKIEVEASHHIHSEFQSLKLNTRNHLHRTAYHFQPPKNWINDPNGPMIYKGIYHLFYQYNPFGAVWGNIVWAHSTSTDLINWIHHPNAIYPTAPFDINGCWSGSATLLHGEKPVILYTGIDPHNNQVQNLAMPKNLSDPYLIEWTKSPQNPLMMPTPSNGINGSSFRDPTTGWLGPDGRWRVIVGSKRKHRGMAVLYLSRDFFHWTKHQHPLHSSNNSGMWECPDFYPVPIDSTDGIDTSVFLFQGNVKHVLKVSLDDTRHDCYTIGSYNPVKDRYTPDPRLVDGDSGLRYDYGKFYASKTFFDNAKNRRILWGWVNESDTEVNNVKKGWSGVQSIPRKIWLHESGRQLVQWPIEEIEKLRDNKVDLAIRKLKGGSTLKVPGVTASQADVEISFEFPNLKNVEMMDPSWTDPQILCSQKDASVKGSLGPFGLLVLASRNLEEQTAIFFRIFKGHNTYVVLMCSDQSRSSLSQEPDKTPYGAFLEVNLVHEKSISLRSLIDHSIVESFGGEGKVCITSRVYPQLAIGSGANIYAFNNGTKSVKISRLNAWTMKKSQIH